MPTSEEDPAIPVVRFTAKISWADAGPECDLLNMPVVAQLEKDAKYELAYQLLKIFLTQKLDAYLEFHSANSSWLKSYGLVHEECITKMRLMSLVDLGANESGHIPYDLILDTLQISEDEVELWAVKAVMAKLIDCKLDQMNQIIISLHWPRVWAASMAVPPDEASNMEG